MLIILYEANIISRRIVIGILLHTVYANFVHVIGEEYYPIESSRGRRKCAIEPVIKSLLACICMFLSVHSPELPTVSVCF